MATPMLDAMLRLLTIAQTQPSTGDGGDRILEYSVAAVLSAVIAWLLKMNTSDRREATATNKEIAAANVKAMESVASEIKSGGEQNKANFEAIRASIERADQRAVRAALVSHTALELLGPPGAGRPTMRQINEAVDTACRRLGLL